MPSPSRSKPMRRRDWLGWLGAVGALGLQGCTSRATNPLRVGLQAWPGYAFFHLANDAGAFKDDWVQLVETPSGSASVRGLAIHTLEAACLTLDEVLGARARQIDLRVVAVLDESFGGDALLASPGFTRVGDLSRRRIGVESSAVGAVVLDAALRLHGMSTRDLTLVSLDVDQHLDAYRSGHVDAIVTYEPTRTLLLKEGARELFSSKEAPGLILDTFAVRADVLQPRAHAIRLLLNGHFQALEAWRQDPERFRVRLAERLGVPPEAVPLVMDTLRYPNLAENVRFLGSDLTEGALTRSAQHLQEVMYRGGLLPQAAPTLDTPLIHPGFLPTS